MWRELLTKKNDRSRDMVRPTLLACLVFLVLFTSESAPAEFDTSAWKRFRNLRIPAENSTGVAAIALESNVLEKCRPDLADIRIVSSDGSPGPFTIMEAPGDEELNPFPVRVFRIARNPGKWTDIWIDKSAKTLTRGVLLQTSSRDFVRKVEIRGSDNGKEEYVISMDGLVMDISKPLPINSLKLMHPVNNFQYIHLRIMNDDNPPLKIEGMLCYPPSPANYLSRPMDFRLVEKRTDASANTTTLVADLGDKRFPLGRAAVVSPAGDFAAKLVLHGAASSTPQVWNKFFEGTVFRVQREEAVKEDLAAIIRPQLFRYIKVELLGGRHPVPVDRIDLTASMRVVVFEHNRDRSYRLYYDNPSATPVPHDDKLLSANMTRIASASLETAVEEEQKNVPPREPPKASYLEPEKHSGVAKAFGVILLLAGLLLLFSLMLRARSLRKAERRRNSRIVYTKFD
jgi:hypothetical protein